MIDLSTKAGVLRFCELRRAEMAADFERVGRFEMNGYSFGAYVLGTHAIAALDASTWKPEAWRTGARLPQVQAMRCQLPQIVGQTMPWQDVTGFFGYTLKHFARATRARGVVFMTEAWRVILDEGEEPAPDRPYGWVEKDPRRMEALMMTLEHADFGYHQWFANILREPTRLEPWVKQPEGLRQGPGRLTNRMSWMQ